MHAAASHSHSGCARCPVRTARPPHLRWFLRALWRPVPKRCPRWRWGAAVTMLWRPGLGMRRMTQHGRASRSSRSSVATTAAPAAPAQSLRARPCAAPSTGTPAEGHAALGARAPPPSPTGPSRPAPRQAAPVALPAAWTRRPAPRPSPRRPEESGSSGASPVSKRASKRATGGRQAAAALAGGGGRRASGGQRAAALPLCEGVRLGICLDRKSDGALTSSMRSSSCGNRGRGQQRRRLWKGLNQGRRGLRPRPRGTQLRTTEDSAGVATQAEVYQVYRCRLPHLFLVLSHSCIALPLYHSHPLNTLRCFAFVPTMLLRFAPLPFSPSQHPALTCPSTIYVTLLCLSTILTSFVKITVLGTSA
mmetsp:Transcript_16255/g.48410  ORF Transcript_16255/g.48410 Transcript_16255/m.48410 type:complete len:363 (+) Transcript_16255:448-1536(+)